MLAAPSGHALPPSAASTLAAENHRSLGKGGEPWGGGWDMPMQAVPGRPPPLMPLHGEGHSGQHSGQRLGKGSEGGQAGVDPSLGVHPGMPPPGHSVHPGMQPGLPGLALVPILVSVLVPVLILIL